MCVNTSNEIHLLLTISIKKTFRFHKLDTEKIYKSFGCNTLTKRKKCKKEITIQNLTGILSDFAFKLKQGCTQERPYAISLVKWIQILCNLHWRHGLGVGVPVEWLFDAPPDNQNYSSHKQNAGQGQNSNCRDKNTFGDYINSNVNA